MIYPIYLYNTQNIDLIFPDVGLELAAYDFFLVSDEDVLENIYRKDSTLYQAVRDGRVVFTNSVSQPFNVQTIIQPPFFEYATKDYYVVDTIAMRDAIPLNKRMLGLIAYVVSEQKEFRLVGGINNINWILREHAIYPGGNLHALATRDVSGFLSNVDKAKLDDLVIGNEAVRFRNITTIRSTTSSIFQVYDFWDVGVWGSGIWRFTYNIDFQTSPLERIVELRILFDTTPLLTYRFDPPFRQNTSGVFYIQVNDELSHSLSILYRRVQSATITINFANMEIRRA